MGVRNENIQNNPPINFADAVCVHVETRAPLHGFCLNWVLEELHGIWLKCSILELKICQSSFIVFLKPVPIFTMMPARPPIDIPQGRTIDPRITAVHFAAPSQAVSQIQKYWLVPFPSLVLAPFLQQYRLAIPRNEGRYRIQRSPTPSHKTFSRYVMQHASLLHPLSVGREQNQWHFGQH